MGAISYGTRQKFVIHTVLIEWILYMVGISWGFPGGAVVKNPPANGGDAVSIPGSGRFPWSRKWQPAPVFLPGKVHGLRGLAGYSPWNRKESDMTE